MLDELDTIEWSKLNYPNMALWLRNLTSDDDVLRNKTYDNLYDAGVDYLSDASPYIVPFLIELLRNTKTDTSQLLLLLMQLASEADTYIRQHLKVTLAESTLNQIAKGTDLYLTFLDDPETTDIVLQLLTYLKDDAEKTVPHLFRYANQENAAYKSAALIALATLADTLPAPNNVEHELFFMELLKPQQEERIRIAAALGLAQLLKEKAPNEAEDIIVTTIINVDSGQLEWSVYNLTQYLIKLGTDRAIQSLVKLLPKLRDMNTVYNLLPVLLDLSFNNGNLVNYSKSLFQSNWIVKEINFDTYSHPIQGTEFTASLSEIQKQIISAVIQSDPVWEVETNLFSHYGLPNLRQQMRDLIT